MRILVVGAGAVGGYFGGRLCQNGHDVTFLVRARRAAELDENGLVVEGPHGDFAISAPKTVQANQINSSFELILLSCKAYGLDEAIESFAPAVGADTKILPLLNGMRHLKILDDRFGAERIFGGQCVISATLGERGVIRQLTPAHSITYGARDKSQAKSAAAVHDHLKNAGFELNLSEEIMLQMWEKWAFLATLAGCTCLCRGPVGAINTAPGGRDLMLGMFSECRQIASTAGYAPRKSFVDRSLTMLGEEDSRLKASMLRDVERGAPTEAEHIIGDLISRAADQADVPLLKLAFTHLSVYERERETAERSGASA